MVSPRRSFRASCHWALSASVTQPTLNNRAKASTHSRHMAFPPQRFVRMIPRRRIAFAGRWCNRGFLRLNLLQLLPSPRGPPTMQPIYLDYNATTPTDPAVLEAMLPYLREHFGNASSSHVYGKTAHAAVDQARRHVADLIGAHPEEIVFTGGGSEASN